MSHLTDFQAAFAALPLIAILRGVTPDEVEGVSEALVDTGFRIVEVPLNSPEPLISIERLARRLAGRATVGAGTVLSEADVARVAAAGGTLIISPNADPAVIRASAAAGLASLPGVFTATEAFAALAAGAHALKLFPAEAASPAVLKAMRAVLPRDVPLCPVGGITPDTMAAWRKAGASGFGIGSALYAPGATPADISGRAKAFVQAFRRPNA